jgi:hypothetical protein
MSDIDTDEWPRVFVIAEKAKRTFMQVAGKANARGSENDIATVSVGRHGKYWCQRCNLVDDCFHARAARRWMATQSAEPSTLPTVPIPSEGHRR